MADKPVVLVTRKLPPNVEARLEQPTPPYDVADEGLVVWPGPGYETEEVKDLDPFLLGRHPVRWTEWVEAWEADGSEPGRRPLLPEVKLLPG